MLWFGSFLKQSGRCRNVLQLSDCLYLVPNHVYSFRNVLHIQESLYFVPNHVYSFRNVLQPPDCLCLVPNHVYFFRNILQLPDPLYLVPNHVYSFRNNLHFPDSLYFIPTPVPSQAPSSVWSLSSAQGTFPETSMQPPAPHQMKPRGNVANLSRSFHFDTSFISRQIDLTAGTRRKEKKGYKGVVSRSSPGKRLPMQESHKKPSKLWREI